MKQIWKIFAACLLAAAMTACGAAAEEPAMPEKEETVPPAEEIVPAEAPETLVKTDAPQEAEAPAEPAAQEETEEPEAPEEAAGPTLEDALAYVDRDVSEMYDAIGEPLNCSYEASCMGDGDDGILEYEDFIVFTYREKDGSAETVVDAE